jgi:hypothetical protein
MRKTCYSQETEYIRLHPHPEGNTIATTYILSIYLVIFVHMAITVFLHLALNRHISPNLSGRTRMCRRWLIFTHGNGFDQGIKIIVSRAAGQGQGPHSFILSEAEGLGGVWGTPVSRPVNFTAVYWA